MTDNEGEHRPDETGTGWSNEALGLILAALVVAWFILGVTYAAFVNYGG